MCLLLSQFRPARARQYGFHLAGGIYAVKYTWLQARHVGAKPYKKQAQPDKAALLSATVGVFLLQRDRKSVV